MNAVNKKHNEKDNEMVQLTKIILKQTARHNSRYCLPVSFSRELNAFQICKNASYCCARKYGTWRQYPE